MTTTNSESTLNRLLRIHARLAEDRGETVYGSLMVKAADGMDEQATRIAELEGALSSALACMQLQQRIEQGRGDKGAKGWDAPIDHARRVLGEGGAS